MTHDSSAYRIGTVLCVPKVLPSLLKYEFLSVFDCAELRLLRCAIILWPIMELAD